MGGGGGGVFFFFFFGGGGGGVRCQKYSCDLALFYVLVGINRPR